MSEGIKTVIYPVSDLARAKAAFGAVLGASPAMDETYYVQFNVGDIKGTLQALLDAGAEVDEELKDVGGGRLIASVKDADGNLIGLLQDT